MTHSLVENIIGLEGLNLQEIMPSLYYHLLYKKEKYETGADYSEEQLNTKIVYKCRNCNGKGWYMALIGEDDYAEEYCEYCNETGKCFVESI